MASQSIKSFGRLPPLPSIREILRIYNVYAMKSLSQNFLLDPKLINKFVSMARPIRDKTVLEIGPGPGNITRAILQQNPKYVIGVEKDTRFTPALSLLQEASNGKLLLCLGDIRSLQMNKLFPEDSKRKWEDESPPIHLIGNLPFNVSLPLTIMWLREICEKSSAWHYGRVPLTLTFQHEVAQRMVAPAEDLQRCRFSLMCQNWCEVEYKFTISGRAFLPKPDVDVGVVTMVPRIKPLADVEFTIFEKLARNLFNTRRKHCKTSLMTLFPLKRREELGQKLLSVADVDPTKNVICLTNDEITRLVLTYSLLIEEHPSLRTYDYRGKLPPLDFE